ncbi:PSD1 and planctomycete cytochrome C domain-containing protein [Planctellipticum variicoloris]|uniref:PSD1 and planctomycete cytochrome C domain-containing protein n=1 Tax=Planctellipticum variicoloris TaxID=3064265 RepID=UPI0030140BCF|nr:PSD1 and planctomycete cytochrome C domain-containing protein [Planctomycetaceae bacterium SH412]
MQRLTLLAVVWSLGLGVESRAADKPLPEQIEFNRDVRPILSDACFQCHGPDKNQRQAELRLDQAAGYAGTNDKPGAVIPHKPEASELFRRVTTAAPDEVMPPKDSGKTLSARDKEILRRWIEQGAEYQGHWAYLVPTRPAVPAATPAIPARNEIDRFIQARLAAAGLQPAAEADRVTLIRRLTFDLTGLPPTPADVQAFLQDARPDAYDRLVERLLESPHFGERMAVYWLDLVRFADTAGYHSDNLRDIVPYRDYVIDAFNRNLPFDQFTIEQLAGDLLPEPTLGQKVASGYNRLLQTTEEGGAQAKEYIAKYSADRVRNVADVWLGATLGCAECHDHKFDPFTTQDFYSLGAFFADVQEPAIGGRGPGMLVPSPDQSQRLAELDQTVASARQDLDAAVQALLAGDAAWEQELLADSGWRPLGSAEAKVEGSDVKLAEQTDGSWLAQGAVGAQESFVLTYPASPRGLTALKLEVLADDSLPAKGPGTAGNGNFVLTEFNLSTTGADGKEQPVKLVRAVADHAQNGHAIETAFDGKDATGWAILPHVGQPHEAVFAAEQPFVSEDAGTLTVRLEFRSPHASHSIGRFRLSATTLPDPIARWTPPQVRSVLATPRDQRSADQQTVLTQFLRDQSLQLQPQRQVSQQRQQARDQFVATIPRSLIAQAGPPRTVRVLPRGNWMDDTGEIREPAIPAFLGQVNAEGRRANRLDLASWLVSPENPLTARVFVNRLWKLFYGVGLSQTLEDSGSQGEWPTHPELLDWLAVEFRESDWDVEHMVQLMVLSHSYRQSSVQTSEARAVDPFNRLLSAQQRFRLDAEFVRDNALAISGLLSSQVGGESVKPYQPEGYWDYLNFPRRTWQADRGERQYRRGLYTFWQRSFLHPQMLIFDAPSREECVADRPRSNTPQQALVLLNDPTFFEAARVFATRTLLEGGPTDESRLAWAWQRALSRPPRAAEQQLILTLLQKHRQDYAADPAAARALLTSVGSAALPDGVSEPELAAWVSVTRVLLNLHETVTRL